MNLTEMDWPSFNLENVFAVSVKLIHKKLV